MVKEHNCEENKIFITCDKACDVCNFEGKEDNCFIITEGICEVCGEAISKEV